MKNVLTKITLAFLLICCVICLAGCVFERSSKGSQSNPEATTSHNTVKDEEETGEGKDSANTEGSKDPEQDLSLINQLREDYNFGTCQKLSGNVAVILFYMDDFESSWTTQEISRFTQNEIEPGLLFLEQEAKRYGVELNLTIEESYSKIYYDDEVIKSVRDTGFATADVLWKAAVQINYPSSTKMIEALRRKYNTEEIVCFTIFNKDGTSYALNPKRGTDVTIDEHCIVFARDLNSDRNGPDGWQASVIAHETLHLYGAEDFYASSSRKSLARIYYPNDIMLSAAYNIDANTIDSATAFYVGWTDTVPDVLNKEGW